MHRFGPKTLVTLTESIVATHDYSFEASWIFSKNFTRSYVTGLRFLFPWSVIYCNMLATSFPPQTLFIQKLSESYLSPTIITSQTSSITKLCLCSIYHYNCPLILSLSQGVQHVQCGCKAVGVRVGCAGGRKPGLRCCSSISIFSVSVTVFYFTR